MAPKNGSKDGKPKDIADNPKDRNEAEPKNLANEGNASDQSCATFAKALLYIVPIALYIPWAYRMFKGQPCCPEVPRPPTTAGPMSTHGKPKWPKFPGRGTGSCSQKGEGETGDCEMPRECREETAPPEKDDCKKSRQCLDKCLDKCFSRDGGRGKSGKRKEKKRRDDCDDDDDN